MPQLRLRKPAQKFSTGSSLLDALLGLGQEEPDVTGLVNPLGFGGGQIASAARPWIEGLQASQLGQRLLRRLAEMKEPIDLLIGRPKLGGWWGLATDPRAYSKVPGHEDMIERLTGILDPGITKGSFLPTTTAHEATHLADPLLRSPEAYASLKRTILSEMMYPELGELSKRVLSAAPMYQEFAKRTPRLYESEVFAHGVGDLIGGRGGQHLRELIEDQLFKYLGVR